MTWERVARCDVRARELADRHYSRQSTGARDFMGPGRLIVMMTPCSRAVWGAIENLDPVGRTRWRCSIFRNEGAGRSSDLIRSATSFTFAWWRSKYGRLPSVPLTTEIDADATAARRGKRHTPGWCFIQAGWRYIGIVGGSRRPLHVLEAPTQ